MKEKVQTNILAWMESNIDQEVKEEILSLLKNDEKELAESFYKNLEFGTGGMRGIMGIGTNRINKYTIGLATQGLANYLKREFKDLREIKTVIAYDTRNNSKYFAEITAEVFSANGIKAYIFDNFRPTPQLSYTIRKLNAQGGVVITASHNPKEYNGYKVYWEDGGQIISPHDKEIIEEVKKMSISDIKFGLVKEKVEVIGQDIDKTYLEKLTQVSINPDAIKEQSNLKIVYSPLHGTGVDLLPKALKLCGFENVNVVAEQAVPDGNFPTVESPNPENAAALELALKKAKEIDADIVLATDPDADRIGIAVKDNTGEFILLNGNQTGSILNYYVLANLRERDKLSRDDYIVKTIVTTDLIEDIASKFSIKTHNVLTGFKYIAAIMKKYEYEGKFLGGFEESYGYLFGNFVRDKDAIMSGMLICEAVAWAKQNGKSMYEMLLDIYLEYGFYQEALVSIVRKGKEGAEEIATIMQNFRDDAPAFINDVNIVVIRDYLTGTESNLFSGEQSKIDLPSSNVIQFVMEDMTKITVRPSGTEPKIKFYISVKDKLKKLEDFEEIKNKAEKLLDSYKKSLDITTA